MYGNGIANSYWFWKEFLLCKKFFPFFPHYHFFSHFLSRVAVIQTVPIWEIRSLWETVILHLMEKSRKDISPIIPKTQKISVLTVFKKRGGIVWSAKQTQLCCWTPLIPAARSAIRDITVTIIPKSLFSAVWNKWLTAVISTKTVWIHSSSSGGLNDYWANSPLGEIKYENITEEDKFSFFPALSQFFQSIKEASPETRIIYIVCELLSDEMKNGIHEICEYYGIETVEPRDITLISGHPNDEGMKKISTDILTYLKESENNWFRFQSFPISKDNCNSRAFFAQKGCGYFLFIV